MGGKANAQRVMLETVNTAKGIWGKRNRGGDFSLLSVVKKTF